MPTEKMTVNIVVAITCHPTVIKIDAIAINIIVAICYESDIKIHAVAIAPCCCQQTYCCHDDDDENNIDNINNDNKIDNKMRCIYAKQICKPPTTMNFQYLLCGRSFYKLIYDPFFVPSTQIHHNCIRREQLICVIYHRYGRIVQHCTPHIHNWRCILHTIILQ